MKLKVAIVYHFFAHYRAPVINELSSCQEIEFYFLGGAVANKNYKSLKLHRFKKTDKFIQIKNFWFGTFLWQYNLRKILAKNKFDAVIFLGDWKFLSTWWSLSYLKKRQIPVLFWSHGILNETKTLNNRIKLYFFNKFQFGGFLYDNRAKNIMTKMGYRNTLHVIFNSLDHKKQTLIFNKLNSNYSFNGNKVTPYVIYSGRLEKRKELELLIESVSILKRKNIPIRALIIGDGTYIGMLKKYSESLMVEDAIDFLGSCYDEQVLAKFYINSIASVIPGWAGLSVIHSLTFGVPVITNDDITSHPPEVEAVVEGVTGGFFKKGDSKSLEKKIEYFLNLSEVEKNLYKENCLKMVARNFTPENQVRIIVARLNEIFLKPGNFNFAS